MVDDPCCIVGADCYGDDATRSSSYESFNTELRIEQFARMLLGGLAGIPNCYARHFNDIRVLPLIEIAATPPWRGLKAQEAR
jgi:hypothetical protein